MRPRGIALAALVAIGCSAGASGGDGAAGDTAVLFASGFTGYHGWESIDIPGDPNATLSHLKVHRVEYVNKRPPAGASAFPVGTVIVKEMIEGTPDQRQVLAMVKRGGGFNSSGAAGWEWFELSNLPEGDTVKILWRGVGPPNGEQYGGDATGGCNGCHGAARDNDSVLSPKVRLSP